MASDSDDKASQEYNDNELNCGGFFYQQHIAKGRCGVCGDPYGGTAKDNESGGKYANDILTRTYARGQAIPIVVEITTQHGGWFEIRVCPIKVSSAGKGMKVSLSCLEANILQKSDGSGGRTYMGRSEKSGMYSTEVLLPDNLVCERCVLQWKWKAGNSWGVDGISKRACVGCGPQEEFYGCSDISIVENTDVNHSSHTSLKVMDISTEKSDNELNTLSVTSNSIEDKTTRWEDISKTKHHKEINTDLPTTILKVDNTNNKICKTTSNGPYRFMKLDQWCLINCEKGNCPSSHCECTDTSSEVTTTCKTTSKGPFRFLDLDEWCYSNCEQGYCPKSHCECTEKKVYENVRVCSTTTTGPFKELDFDDWCSTNCEMGFCPKSHCECKDVKRSIAIAISPICKTTDEGPFKDLKLDDWCRMNCKNGYCPKSHCKCY